MVFPFLSAPVTISLSRYFLYGWRQDIFSPDFVIKTKMSMAFQRRRNPMMRVKIPMISRTRKEQLTAEIWFWLIESNLTNFWMALAATEVLNMKWEVMSSQLPMMNATIDPRKLQIIRQWKRGRDCFCLLDNILTVWLLESEMGN